MIFDFSSIISNLKEKDLYRSLSDCDVVGDVEVIYKKKKFICFCSNDYFGLSQNSLVKKAAISAIKKYGFGAGASRYVSGNNSLYFKLEKEIAEIKNTQDALIFSSGYSCAIGVIPALVADGDLIVADKLIHSSLIDGAKLSGAKLLRFAHNDIDHARLILQQNRNKFKRCLMITETIFSMDGDLGKVDELKKLAKEFEAFLLVDDAHGLWQKSKKKSENFLIQTGTLSKAIGSLGGYVAADKMMIDYLRNFSKSQIYSTALPPAVLAASLAAILIVKKEDLAKKLINNVRYFCELMELTAPQSAIVPIIIGDNKKTLEIAKKLRSKGFLISAIRPPTVEVGKARLRITFSSQHKKSQIKNLALVLKKELG